MHDPFEESLKDLLRTSVASRNDDEALGRVLKTANRQVGAGELFSLVGHWFGALMIAVSSGAPHVSPARRSKLEEDDAV